MRFVPPTRRTPQRAGEASFHPEPRAVRPAQPTHLTMPDLDPLSPDWTLLTPFWESLGTHSFVSADPDGDRIRVRYYATPDGQARARVWFGPGAEGPPGHAHGGATAALLDEAMGMAALATGRVVVAARIEVDFRQMVPLGAVYTVELATDAADRKVAVTARMFDADRQLVAEATGVFVDIGTDRLGQAAEAAGRA